MKKLFIGIFLLAITSIFSEGKTWDDAHEVGKVFMVITHLLEQKKILKSASSAVIKGQIHLLKKNLKNGIRSG